MSNDDPAFCRLISMLEFQFAVDRTKVGLLENPLELKGKQTKFGVKHRSAATNWTSGALVQTYFRESIQSPS